jgi:hypothetical protein
MRALLPPVDDARCLLSKRLQGNKGECPSDHQFETNEPLERAVDNCRLRGCADTLAPILPYKLSFKELDNRNSFAMPIL